MAVLVVAVLGVAAAAWLKESLPSEVPLLYSLPWGKEQLVPSRYWLVGAVGVLVMFGINTQLAGKVRRIDSFLGSLLTWANVLLTALFGVTLWKIWLIFR